MIRLFTYLSIILIIGVITVAVASYQVVIAADSFAPNYQRIIVNSADDNQLYTLVSPKNNSGVAPLTPTNTKIPATSTFTVTPLPTNTPTATPVPTNTSTPTDTSIPPTDTVADIPTPTLASVSTNTLVPATNTAITVVISPSSTTTYTVNTPTSSITATNTLNTADKLPEIADIPIQSRAQTIPSIVAVVLGTFSILAAIMGFLALRKLTKKTSTPKVESAEARATIRAAWISAFATIAAAIAAAIIGLIATLIGK